MICNNCHKLLKDDAKFCPYCGKPVIQPVSTDEIPEPQEQPTVTEANSQKSICKYCGKSIAENAKFCPYCGKDLTTPKQQTPPTAEQKSSQVESSLDLKVSMNQIFGSWVFLALSIVFTMYVLLSLPTSSSDQSASETEVEMAYLFVIPNICICIGCWMAFFNGRRRNRKTSGLTLISGGLGIQIVIYEIPIILCGLLCFLAFYYYATESSDLTEALLQASLGLLIIVWIYFGIQAWPLSALRKAVRPTRDFIRDEQNKVPPKKNKYSGAISLFVILIIVNIADLFATSYIHNTINDAISAVTKEIASDGSLFGSAVSDLVEGMLQYIFSPLLEENPNETIMTVLLIVILTLVIIILTRLRNCINQYETDAHLSDHV